jgi:hypothetical protein
MVGQDEKRGVRGRKRARQSILYRSRFRALASTNSNGMTGTGAGPETGSSHLGWTGSGRWAADGTSCPLLTAHGEVWIGHDGAGVSSSRKHEADSLVKGSWVREECCTTIVRVQVGVSLSVLCGCRCDGDGVVVLIPAADGRRPAQAHPPVLYIHAPRPIPPLFNPREGVCPLPPPVLYVVDLLTNDDDVGSPCMPRDRQRKWSASEEADDARDGDIGPGCFFGRSSPLRMLVRVRYTCRRFCNTTGYPYRRKSFLLFVAATLLVVVGRAIDCSRYSYEYKQSGQDHEETRS